MENTPVISIVFCVGCGKKAEAGDACNECLTRGPRGPAFIATCRRIRANLECDCGCGRTQREHCYAELPNDRVRQAFVKLYGDPSPSGPPATVVSLFGRRVMNGTG